MTGGAICDGGERFEGRFWQFCPTEDRRQRFYGYFQHWYGWSFHCLGCGDRWNGDGELGPRPFMRGWRQEAIKRYKRQWDGVTTPANRRRAAFRAFVTAYFADQPA